MHPPAPGESKGKPRTKGKKRKLHPPNSQRIEVGRFGFGVINHDERGERDPASTSLSPASGLGEGLASPHHYCSTAGTSLHRPTTEHLGSQYDKCRLASPPAKPRRASGIIRTGAKRTIPGKR